MKKFIWFFAGMIFATSISVFALSEAEYAFTDQESFKGAWYYDEAVEMLQRQIIKGDDDGNLNPNNAVNRAEMAVMLDRTIDYVEDRADFKVESNNYNLLEALSALDLLNDATPQEIAFVSVSMGEHHYDYFWSYWWLTLDEMLDLLVEDKGCVVSSLIINGSVMSGYSLYDCADSSGEFYIYDEIDKLLHGQF